MPSTTLEKLVVMTVIKDMGEKQGYKDLATHIRNCEDMLIRLEYDTARV